MQTSSTKMKPKKTNKTSCSVFTRKSLNSKKTTWVHTQGSFRLHLIRQIINLSLTLQRTYLRIPHRYRHLLQHTRQHLHNKIVQLYQNLKSRKCLFHLNLRITCRTIIILVKFLRMYLHLHCSKLFQGNSLLKIKFTCKNSANLCKIKYLDNSIILTRQQQHLLPLYFI